MSCAFRFIASWLAVALCMAGMVLASGALAAEQASRPSAAVSGSTAGSSAPAAEPAKDKPAEPKPLEAETPQPKPPEEKPAQAKPQEAKPEPATPEEAKPPEAKPAEAKSAEAKPAEFKFLDSRGQPASMTVLGHPAIAERLKLTEQQRAKIAALLAERNEALGRAAEPERARLIAESDKRLAAVLTDSQKAEWARNPPDPLLRFNYRYQKWVDVLEELARQAGLSLVLDSPPPGTFNYSDPREYTPTEAIDLVNSVLVTKGYTLVRHDRMLVLIDLSQGIPEGLIPRVAVEELADRGKFEMVSVLFPLEGRSASTVESEIKVLLGPYGKTVPLPATGQLLVTDRAGIMDAIQRVIKSLPVPPATPRPSPPEKPVLEVHPVAGADPQTALEVLKTLYPSATFALDPKTDQINCHGGPSVQAGVKKVLEQMKAGLPPEKQRRLETYPIDEDSAAQALKHLEGIVPEAKLTADPRLGRLVVWGLPWEHEAVKAALEKLSPAPAVSRARQFEAYRLSKADPKAVLEMLQALFPNARLAADTTAKAVVAIASPEDQRGIKAILEQLQPDKPGPDTPELKFYPVKHLPTTELVSALQKVAPAAQVTADPGHRRVIAVATAPEHERIKATIEQFEKGTPIQEKNKLVVYPVTPAQRKRFEAVLSKLSAEIPGIQVLPETEPGELAIWTKPEQHKVIEELLEQFKSEPAGAEKFVLSIYPITTASPQSVLEMFKKLHTDVQVVLDEKNNRLVVWAHPADHARIKTSLDEIQAPAPVGQQPRFETHRVYGADLATIVANLQPLVPNAKLTLDAKTGRLVVFGTPAEQETVRQALGKLGRGGGIEDTPQVETYALSKADPGTVVSLLQTLVPEAKISVDSQTKTLVAIAVPADQQAIRSLVDQLEGEAPPEKKPHFEVYPLHGADLTTLSSTLQPLVPNAKLTPDPKGGKLIVWASPAEQELIRGALAKLGRGVPSDNTPEVQVYRLTKADPATTLSLLQTLLPEAKLSVDSQTRSLIAVAVPADQRTIRTVLEQLQPETPPPDAPQIRFYPLSRVQTPAIVSTLQGLAPKAQITLEPGGKRLTIVASPSDQAILKAAIEQIEKVAVLDETARLVSYPVTPTQKKRFQAVLSGLSAELPGIQVIADTEPGELAIWAKPSQHAVLADVLEQLKREIPAAEKYELFAHSVRAVDPNSVLQVMKALFPNAQFVLDSRSRRLIIWSLPEEHKAIQEALEKIDSGMPGDTQDKFMAYPVPEADPATAIKMIQELLPEVKATSDPKAGTILVWARQSEHDQIAKILKQMQAGPDPEHKPTLVVYPIPSGDPSAVATVLKGLVPKATVTVDPQSSTLAASATPQEHELIRAAVEQMSKQESADRAYRLVVYTVESGGSAAVNNAIPILKAMFPSGYFGPGNEPGKLAAWARPADHVAIKRTIEELTKKEPPELAPETALYSLEHVPAGGAAALISILKTMFPDAVIQPGPEPNKLVVRARPAEHAEIKAAIEEMTRKEPPETARRMVVYTVPSRAAGGITGVLSVLRSMFPEVQFAAGTEPDQLVAFARPADHDAIKQAVEELSKEESPEKARQIAVYTLESADASSPYYMLSMLRGMFPNAQFSLGAQADKLVVWARPEDQKAIKQTLDQMAQKEPAATAKRMVVYRLGRSGSTGVSGAITILKTMFPQAEFAAGPEPSQVVAFARPADHERIQAAIEELGRPEPPETAPRIAVYTIRSASRMGRYYTISMLRGMFPDAQFSTGAEPDKLVVLARPADQERIKQTIEELSKREPPETAARAVVYDVPSVGASTAANFLQSVFSEAEFSPGADPDKLIVWARPEEHAVIQQAIEQIEAAGESTGKRVLAAYPMRSHDAQSLSRLIDPGLRRSVQLVPDPQRGRLLVWAEPKHQEAIKKTIEQFQKEAARIGEPTAQVYRFQWADPRAAQSVLSTLVPTAEIALDTTSNSLVVSATPEEHAQIKATIDEMEKEGEGGQAARLQIHRLKTGDPARLLAVLQGLFRAHPGVQLSLDETSDAIVAVAAPAQHQTIRRLIEQLEKVSAAGTGVSLETYPLEDADPMATMRMLTSLLDRQGVRAELSYEPRSNQLIAIAKPEQHAAIKEALARTKGEPRTLEIVQLEVVEPSTAELAIERLFSDGGYYGRAHAPSVDVDYTTQQLFIRATKEQFAKIRDLLVKMGETGLAETAPGDTRRTRTVPFDGDLKAALEEIQRIWPKLRPNPIQIVSPPSEIRVRDRRAEQQEQSAGERVQPAQGPPPELGGATPRNEAKPPPDSAPPGSRGGDPQGWRPSGKAVAPGSGEPSVEDSQWRPSAAPHPWPAPAKPVLVIPGDGSVTISSDDPAALAQFEELLRVMARQKGVIGRNYNIFILKNAKASGVAKTLQQLFRTMAIPGRGPSSVVIVPDERLNAIVAYANRTDRATIESLLKILDSAEVPEAMAAERLHLIPVKNTSASRMEAMLRSLFKDQVEAMSVEDVTNSVVVMGAAPLVEEIKAVVDVLDTAAGGESSRGVTIVPLRKTNAERVEKALDIILRHSPRRRSR